MPPLQETEQGDTLVIPLADVPSIPRGTLIEVAEVAGGDVLPWLVDSTERADVDHHRVLVVAGPES